MIDGFSQPGGRVEIDGSLIESPLSFGILEIRGSEIAIRGLVLNNHPNSNGIGVEAILFQDGAEFHESISIMGCLIGTEPDGSTASPNARGGVALTRAETVQIGGPAFWQRNVISGNARLGIDVRSNVRGNVRIINNYVGTDISGTVAVPNGQEGIQSNQVSEVEIVNNVVSGNGGVGF